MKQRLSFILKVYSWFLLMFILQKPLFMLYHFSLYRNFDFLEWLKVMFYGIPLDLSVAAYVTVIPVLIVIGSVWLQGRWLKAVFNVYFALICMALAIIFICDAELYSYWGFRLDATPLFYLRSPSDAAASVPLAALILVPVCIAFYFFVWWFPLYRFAVRDTAHWRFMRRRGGNSLALLLIMAFLIVPIRGGFSVAVMNVGHVYFSPELVLNHAAINPAFSFLSSAVRENQFDKQYRFYPPEEADAWFARLYPDSVCQGKDTVRLIKERPNIVFVVLESFAGTAMETLGGTPGVMPNLEKLADEGILFTRFYANSFRTDRGLVSILSGYPAQPSTSIMKYPSKSQTLPSISGVLRKEGYDLEFLYGGDADFTNMRSYFRASGFNKIVDSGDFPVRERLSKWGVNDGHTFPQLLKSMEEQQDFPFMKFFLTLSSHEPFDVPYHHLEHPYLNSVAYTDSCIGAFVSQFRQSPLWDNTLLIFLPDHSFRYPRETIQDFTSAESHLIPMVWAGGAVLRSGERIDTYGSQIDLAATLLSQLGLPHDEFPFSKNLTDPCIPHFVWYSFINGFGYLDEKNYVVYDADGDRMLVSEGKEKDAAEAMGKAFLQKLYDDLGRR